VRSFTVIAAVTEFERNIITERVRAGVRNAQAKGIKCGRPRAGFDFKKALELRKNGDSLRQIARQVGVGSTTQNVARTIQSALKVSRVAVRRCSRP